MRKVCLVFLVNESFDCLGPFKHAFSQAGFYVETIGVPNVWLSGLTVRYVKRLKALINQKKSQGYFVIFSPQSTELFLKEPDLTIVYSAYRSWFDHEKMQVIPHLWTPVGPPKSIDDIAWTSKPPLRIGFMGRLHSTSRLANIMSKAPMPLKQWFLRGSYLKKPHATALMNDLGRSIASVNAFSRIETIKALKDNIDKYPDVELDIVEIQGFHGSDKELKEYFSHLERSTYVVCPRGIENYSFRIYEALSRGRIPVIIDTDIVLPKEINWEQLSVTVPYERLHKIYDAILRDYNSRSGPEFVARQQQAISTMAELRSMRWVNDLANELGSFIKDI